jgi:16S rRNA (guanine527-N7)-methyltransferase
VRTPPLLEEVLLESKQLGFLGPGPVEDHLRNAEGFAHAVTRPPARFLDLGSGGGVPGLVLAVSWPESEAVLLDASVRRTSFLRRAVISLDLEARVEVRTARAEGAGHDPTLRGGFDVVTARSFGPPAWTAECGAAFLRSGGVLLVSDPPTGEERWAGPMLASLGLRDGGASGLIRTLIQAEPYPARAPRPRGR